MPPADWKERLVSALGKRIRLDEPLSAWTYFQVGGPADALVVPETEDDLATVLRLVNEWDEGVPLTVIGMGTNLVVRDGGIRGIVVVMTGAFAAIERAGRGRDVRLSVGAGVPVCDLTAYCIENALTGFEFAAGIPGNLGGAIFMNAGTREGEMKDVLDSVRMMDETGHVCTVSRADLDMTYRRTNLGARRIILGGTLKLAAGDAAAVRAKCDELVAWREQKQPGDLPCAGSIFKNPGDVPAARLIHQAGLKGARVGGAVVSPKHTNFIVNDGGATAKDILALIEHVRDAVEKEHGIRLETEVRILGDDA